MTDNKMTGYPSIDKPWLKYYSEEEINTKFPKMNMKQYLYENNIDNLDKTAINYYGRRISYGKMFEMIELVKKAFAYIGVNKQDCVSIAAPFIPEVVYCVYALNDIGAVVNLVDPRVPSAKLLRYFTGSNTKYLVMFDSCAQKVKEIESQSNVKTIISVSAADSLSFGMKLLSKLKKGLKSEELGERYIKWNSFIGFGKKQKTEIKSYYKENAPAVIVYTSGTSGEPKGAVASNETYNNLACSQIMCLKDTDVGDRFLLIMPPFIAYGLAVGMHGQLCRGQELVMVPSFSIENEQKMMGDLVAKYKPQTIMGVPTFIVDLIKHPKMKKSDLSFLKTVIVGGDSMTKTAEEKVNKFLKSRNSRAVVCKGWGLTEVNSAFSYTRNSRCNKLGSVGIPLIGNNIKIVRPENSEYLDFDSVEEVKYGEEGEIFINSNSVILDYLNNQEESKRCFFISKKTGEKWVRTKDLGKIDQDGIIYISGRIKRIIIRPDGHNISPFAIENIVCQDKRVEACAVVGAPSKEHEHGSIAVCYIKIKKPYTDMQEQILTQLKGAVEKELPPRDVASTYQAVDEMPLTRIGKIDYKALERMASSQ